jgi:hypothetical protein
MYPYFYPSRYEENNLGIFFYDATEFPCEEVMALSYLHYMAEIDW